MDINEQLTTLLESWNIKFFYTCVGRGGFDGKGKGYNWRVEFARNLECPVEFNYFTGASKGDVELADVLHCLLVDSSYAGYDFDEFCEDFGYDTDSRRVYGIWEQLRDTDDKLNKLFTESQLDQLRELLQDY